MKLMICRYADFCNSIFVGHCSHRSVHEADQECDVAQHDCSALSGRVVYHRETPWDNKIRTNRAMNIHCVEIPPDIQHWADINNIIREVRPRIKLELYELYKDEGGFTYEK